MSISTGRTQARAQRQPHIALALAAVLLGGTAHADEYVLSQFGLQQGWSSQDAYPRLSADVDGDGLDDIVGFGNGAVLVATARAPQDYPLNSGGFNTATAWLRDLTTDGSKNPNVWASDQTTPRLLGDVNGDGKADIVALNGANVYVALSGGTAFAAPKIWLSDTALASNFRNTQTYPLALADVDGDGRADLVGFASDGVYVARSTGSGFGGMQRWLADFGVRSGWLNNDLFPRMLVDVNGDGRADIVGFNRGGVAVSLSNGSGSFRTPTMWLQGYFGSSSAAGGWISNRRTPRLVGLKVLPDVKRAAIVAFSDGAVYVSRVNDAGTAFQPPEVWSHKMTSTIGGWSDNQTTPRLLSNGDNEFPGLPLRGVIGFGSAGVARMVNPGYTFTTAFQYLDERNAPTSTAYVSSADMRPPTSWTLNAADDWMKNLPDGTAVRELSLPGTHDTMTSRVRLPYVVTQNWNLSEQLDAGIRAIDIRTRTIDNRLVIHHGNYYLFYSMEQVLDELAAWLKFHPYEGVLMRVQANEIDAGTPNTAADFYKVWNALVSKPKYAGLFVDGTVAANYYDSTGRYVRRNNLNTDFQNLTLGDIRGKLVVLASHSVAATYYSDVSGTQVTTSPWDVASNMKDYTGYDIRTWWVKYFNPTIFDLDSNEAPQVSEVDARRTAIKAHLDKSQNPPADQLESPLMYNTNLAASSTQPPDGWARDLNPTVYDYLGYTSAPRRLGIIQMDFPGEKLIYRIIKSNPFPSRNGSGYCAYQVSGECVIILPPQ